MTLHTRNRLVFAGALALLAGGLAGSSSGSSAVLQAPPTAIFGAPLGTAAPALLYDAGAGAATSIAAGITNYIVPGDFNGDGYPDLVNVTSRGAQVFHNRGTIGGVFTIERIQDITLAQFSWGGGAVDVDIDGDLDLVLGDLGSVVVAKNDGTGHFTATNRFKTGWGVPTLAVPFRPFVIDGQPSGQPHVVIAAAAESLTNDAVGPNPDRRPRPYVLRYDPVMDTFVVVEQLSVAINADGVTFDDLDSDGDVDFLVTNRSNQGGGLPFRAFRNNPAAAPFFPQTPAFDFTGVGFEFGFGASVAPGKDILFGSWAKASLLRFTLPPNPNPLGNPAAAWQDAESIPLDIGNAFATAELFQTEFADMDHDGNQDAVLMGATTPLVLVEINGPQVGNRFTGAPVSGRTYDFQVADWDIDTIHSRDVISGGEKGLYFHRNLNGGAAGVPGMTPEPAPDCSESLQAAYFGLEDLLDPTRQPPLDSPLARDHAADAQGELNRIDPRFIDHNQLPGMTAADLAALNAYLVRVNNADDDLEGAAIDANAAGEPDDVDRINAIRMDLAEASMCINDRIVDLVGNSAKRATRRKLERLRERMLADRDAAVDAAAAARIETDRMAQGERIGDAIWYANRSIKRGIKLLKILR